MKNIFLFTNSSTNDDTKRRAIPVLRHLKTRFYGPLSYKCNLAKKCREAGLIMSEVSVPIYVRLESATGKS